MSLSDLELEELAAALARDLVGVSIGKVWQPDETTVLVEVGKRRLLLATHPRASRIHTIPRGAGGTASTAGHGGPAGAGGPPTAFAMLLRKHLSGLRLRALDVLPGERVLVLGFGEALPCLVAELTPPHGNLFLLGGDGLLLGSLVPVRAGKRGLAPGAPWSPPPAAPVTARWRGRDRFKDAPDRDAAVAALYATTLADDDERALRARAQARLQRALDRVARRIAALEEDGARIARAADLRKHADLLLAHRAELPPRGATRVVVPDDFSDGAPLEIALEPALDGPENAARLYRQHRRLSGGKKHVDARLAASRTEKAHLAAQLAAVADLPVSALRAAAGAEAASGAGGAAASPRPRRKDADAPRVPYREFRSSSGDPIWVGRTAADNDTLTFRHARGADLWLHTRDAPGAHVVVPHRTARPIPDGTFLDAATLAAHFSPLRKEAQVDVQYTQVKNLRKPRGAPPGLVSTSQTKTIRVRLEPARVARLLGEILVE